MKLFSNLFKKKEKTGPEAAAVEEERPTFGAQGSADEEPAQPDEPSPSLLDAFNRLQQLVDESPEDTALLIRMAEIACQLKDYVAMQDACERAIVVDSSLLRAHHLYAEACQAQHDVINAIAMSTKAIMLLEGQDTTYPQAADLYRLRGELLMRVGDKAGAEADMQKSVSVEPVRPAR